MKFYNRKAELKVLDQIKGDFRIAILGRRRIGKTRLVEHCYENSISFFFPAEKAEKEIILAWVEEYPEHSFPRVASFREFFTFVFSHFGDFVIFLDEIQNVLKVNNSFLYDLQHLIDKKRPKLVVTGSLISVMKTIVEGYKSPLYGRFDYIMKMKEFDCNTVYEIGTDLNYSFEEIIQFYAVFGGIPKYYEFLEKIGEVSCVSLVQDMFISYPRPLFEEIRTMLREEFGSEYKMFFSILSAIARGNTRLSEIADFVGRKQTDITKYLSLLQKDYEIIERNVPMLGGKRGVYKIKNNIFAFWFSYLWRYVHLLETGNQEELLAKTSDQVRKHTSLVFEQMIRFWITSGILPLSERFIEVGSQWGLVQGLEKGKNEYEIDICAVNEKSILLGECKWKDNVDPKMLLLKLVGLEAEINRSNKEALFVIVAKSFTRKIRKKNVFCFDLNDIERNIKQKIKKEK